MTALARRVVIATAGHVDHGKTALVRALTGTDTDRLPDEKRRGISIELGFATFADEPMSFIDVPGHRRLVHAMIAGVGGVDGVLLVVAADDGVMPQTREHLQVCRLLGITRFVVALSKCDLVDDEMLELARADVEATLAEAGLTARTLVPTSVETGAGLAELKAALLELGRDMPARAESACAWLPIDRVFSVKGAGTVVTGTLTRGSLREGQAIAVVGEGKVCDATCRQLHVHGSRVDAASAPCRVAVNLARVEQSEVARGDALATHALASARLDVVLRGTEADFARIEDGSSALVHVGTARRTVRVTRLGARSLHLALDAALPAMGKVGFVLRGFRSTSARGAVLGGGIVVDAQAPKLPPRRAARAWELRASTLEALADDQVTAALSGLLELARPRPLDAESVERRLGLEPGALSEALAGKKRKGPATTIALPSGREFTTTENVDQLAGDLLRRVQTHHESHPHEPGLSLETARTALARRSGRALADLVLSRLATAGRIVLEEGVVCTAAFAESSGPVVQKLADAVVARLEALGLEGTGENALAGELAQPVERVRAALARLTREHRARRLGTLWFAESAIDALRRKLETHFESAESISVPDLKELAGVSRKQAIPLLEQLDREGTTLRRGDLRVRGPGRR